MGVAEALNRELYSKEGQAGLRRGLKRSLDKKQTNDGDIRQLEKRLKELDAEIETGISNLTELSSKLAGRLRDRLEGLEKQKETVETELAKLNSTTSENGSVSSRVNKVIQNLRVLLKHLPADTVDPMVINESLKACGITLDVKPVSAKARKSDRFGHINIFMHAVQHSQPHANSMHIIPLCLNRRPSFRIPFSW